MNAKGILRKEYKNSRNFMTPRVHETGTFGETDAVVYAYEISSGEGIFNKHMVGLSIVQLDKETGETSRFEGLADKSRSFSGLDLQELIDTARRYVQNLS